MQLALYDASCAVGDLTENCFATSANQLNSANSKLRTEGQSLCWFAYILASRWLAGAAAPLPVQLFFYTSKPLGSHVLSFIYSYL